MLLVKAARSHFSAKSLAGCNICGNRYLGSSTFEAISGENIIKQKSQRCKDTDKRSTREGDGTEDDAVDDDSVPYG